MENAALNSGGLFVAPLAGARIEMTLEEDSGISFYRRSPRGSED